MKQHISSSAEETKKIAAEFAKQKVSGVIALTGDLGAGKTTFVQGFAKGLNIQDKMISPTFVLIRQHHIPETQRKLYHLDLYRLEDGEAFQNLGLEELVSNENNLILIEWAEKVKKLLPKNTVWISMENLEGSQRKITIS